MATLLEHSDARLVPGPSAQSDAQDFILHTSDTNMLLAPEHTAFVH